MKHEWWYIKRLQKYVNKHYGEYDESIEWYANPLPNQWRFVIPELELTILLTCDDEGEIVEERRKTR